MKRGSVVVLFALFISTSVFAGNDTLGPDAARQARREEMKAIKKAQREVRSSAPKAGVAPTKMQSFWKKEGERSGLGDSGNRTGAFVKNLNPVPFFKEQEKKYNERKAVGKVK